MKRFLVLLIASVLLISFSGISFSAVKAGHSKTSALSGKITALDTKTNQITIQDKKGASTTIGAAASQIASLKVDDSVKITLKDDGKTADTIKVMITKGKKSK